MPISLQTSGSNAVRLTQLEKAASRLAGKTLEEE